jgi:hypothetical protein
VENRFQSLPFSTWSTCTATAWDTTEVQRQKEAKKTSDGDGPNIPVCQPKFVSELPDSHVFAVTDLQWWGCVHKLQVDFNLPIA